MSAATLRFDRGLYLEDSVREGAAAFAEYATIEVGEDDAGWTLQVQVEDEDTRRELLGELGNYVLGLTIQGGGVVPTSDDGGEN